MAYHYYLILHLCRMLCHTQHPRCTIFAYLYLNDIVFYLIISVYTFFFFFFSSRRRHTRLTCDWSSDVCSSDLWLHRPPRVRRTSACGALPESIARRVIRRLRLWLYLLASANAPAPRQRRSAEPSLHK